MKRMVYLLSIVLTGIMVTTLYYCESSPLETCEQDEICTDKYVSACCTENTCVYKYDGKVYTESQLDELATDLGCGDSDGALKSGSSEENLSGVIEQLKALMDKVHKKMQVKE